MLNPLLLLLARFDEQTTAECDATEDYHSKTHLSR